MQLERTSWQDLITDRPYTRTFDGATVLPADILMEVVLRLDPVCTRHWASTHPAIADVEAHEYYQRQWCAHHSNYEVTYKHLTRKVVDVDNILSYFSNIEHRTIMALLLRGLDRLVQYELWEHIKRIPALLNSMFRHCGEVHVAYILLDVAEYTPSFNWINTMFSCLRLSACRLSLNVVQRLYIKYKEYVTYMDLYEKYYYTLCNAITDTPFETDDTLGLNQLAYVYDSVAAARNCHFTNFADMYRGATRYGATKVLAYMYTLRLGIREMQYLMHHDIPVADIVHFTQHLSLADIVQSQYEKSIAAVYQAREWTDADINATVNLLVSQLFTADAVALLRMLQSRLACVVIDESEKIGCYLAYLSIMYGSGTCDNDFVNLDRKSHNSAHFTFTATDDTCTITNGRYYLALSAHYMQYDGYVQQDLSTGDTLNYTVLLPNETLTFRCDQVPDGYLHALIFDVPDVKLLRQFSGVAANVTLIPAVNQ